MSKLRFAFALLVLVAFICISCDINAWLESRDYYQVTIEVNGDEPLNYRVRKNSSFTVPKSIKTSDGKEALCVVDLSGNRVELGEYIMSVKGNLVLRAVFK